MKRWTKIFLAAVVLIAAAVASLPLFINANTFRPQIETQLSSVLGRPVKLGDLQLKPFSGEIAAKDLTVADDPNFSTAPFLTAAELRIGIALRPLLFSRTLEIRSFELDSPQIRVLRAANGTWNFSTIAHATARAKANADAATKADAVSRPAPGSSTISSSALPDIKVARLSIQGARISASSLPSHGDPTVYENVNITVSDFSFESNFPFQLSANLPAGGTVRVTGHAGPLNREDAATTPGSAQLSVKGLDPVAAAFLDSSAGVSLVADLELHAASDGQILTTSGSVHMVNLKLRKGAAAAQQPIDLAYSGTHVLKQNSGVIQDASITLGGSAIHVTGTYQPLADGAQDPVLDLKMAGQGLPIDNLQSLMTAVGVRLPNNAVLKGGTLGLDVAIKGQAKALTIAGNVAADNTKMVGFDVGSKIHGIAALSGVKTGDTTNIEKLRATVRITNAAVIVSNIDAVIPEMGELNGSGTVSPANQLDFNFTVQVASAKGIGKVGVGLLTALNGSNSKGAKGVPMRVVGTPDEPVITADVGGAVGKKAKSVFGIFGAKKKDQ